MSKSKALLIAFLGAVHGLIGTLSMIFGIAFLFPDAGPGSRDYEEELFMVPIGVVMIIITLAITVYAFFKVRNEKDGIKTFFVPMLVGSILSLAFLFTRIV